jgi:hypothetical protein
MPGASWHPALVRLTPAVRSGLSRRGPSQAPSGLKFEAGAAGLDQMIRRGSPTNSALAAAPRTGPIAGLTPNANDKNEPKVQPA